MAQVAYHNNTITQPMSDKLKNAIFGYSGLVGSYFIKRNKFEEFYNSSNIRDSMNREYDEIVVCCIPAVKWLANKYPEKDTCDIERIKDVFKTIHAKKVTLVSTIDIYDNINNKSNENTHIQYEKNNTYGRNRFLFEEFIKVTFNDYHIIRLPALFGRGLKKNIIYDLLNNHNVSDVPIHSTFQWYNLEWLNDDVMICKKNNIKECNLFTEPLETICIVNLFKQCDLKKNDNDAHITYDVQTINHRYFPHGSNGYIRTKQDVLKNIEKFINQYCAPPLFALCVSNISNNSLPNEQYYSILKHYGIKYVEIAPTKFFTWNEWFERAVHNSNELGQILESFDLKLYSFQSVTYTICNNIFDENNADILHHFQKVIDLACFSGASNIVFGCPKNRKRINPKLNDSADDDTFVAFFKKLGDYIGGRALIISIENNSQKYDCNYLNTIDQVGKIVRKINHPKIKMMIDVGNCVMENDDIDDACNYKDIIHHVHVSAPFMNPLSYPHYNIEIYSKFIQLLKKINYNKVVSLEFLNNHNDTGTELETLNTSMCNFLDMCAFSFSS